MAGTLSILGIGPGDPGLVTVRAAAVLSRAERVFIPVSRPGRSSMAYGAARGYMALGTPVTELLFPMVRDQAVLEQQYASNCAEIEQALRAGCHAALITLGDPATYSTAWPILVLLRERAPDVRVEVVPGITSYAHGAARARVRLGEGSDIIAIASAEDDLDRLARVLDVADTVVFLKTYRQRDNLIGLLRNKGLASCAVYVKRCGLEDEEIMYDLDAVAGEFDYLSLIIVKKRGMRGGHG